MLSAYPAALARRDLAGLTGGLAERLEVHVEVEGYASGR
jgi:hypothetical protein